MCSSHKTPSQLLSPKAFPQPRTSHVHITASNLPPSPKPPSCVLTTNIFIFSNKKSQSTKWCHHNSTHTRVERAWCPRSTLTSRQLHRISRPKRNTLEAVLLVLPLSEPMTPLRPSPEANSSTSSHLEKAIESPVSVASDCYIKRTRKFFVSNTDACPRIGDDLPNFRGTERGKHASWLCPRDDLQWHCDLLAC